MRFASNRIQHEWCNAALAPKLRGIIEDAAEFALNLFQWDLVITSIYRTPSENDRLYGSHGTHQDGVHVRWRGADVRVNGIDPESVFGLAGYLNERYIYDPERPLLHVALDESASGQGSSGPHLHLQVHNHTRERHVLESN